MVGFKNFEEEDKENCPIGEDLCEQMNVFHESLMGTVSLNALQVPENSVCCHDSHSKFHINLLVAWYCNRTTNKSRGRSKSFTIS